MASFDSDEDTVFEVDISNLSYICRLIKRKRRRI